MAKVLNSASSPLVCDYLVVGAGAASLAFIDTIFTEQPKAKVVMIDKKHMAGGHWVDAYDFVHLHQPSLLYGVASSQLEGNWLKLMFGKFTLPWTHRASKKEILAYYKRFVDKNTASGQLQFFPNCEYKYNTNTDTNNKHKHTHTHTHPSNEDIHEFVSITGGQRKYTVQVRCKVVNGTLGECIVPSTTPLSFPVNQDITVATPNDLYTAHFNKSKSSTAGIIGKNKKYVVLGCGKTGMDTVVFLQRTMKVPPNQISWVIPNDVWMLAREAPGSPWSWPAALLANDGDFDKSCLDLEAQGLFVRMDKNITPTRFRFPVVGKDEIKFMRKVKNLIRRGRVSELRIEENQVVADFGPEHESWTFSDGTVDDHVFVHCASPGPFNGKPVDKMFMSDKALDLALLYAPPVPMSQSSLGYLESKRANGTIDVEFGRRLLAAKNATSVEDYANATSQDVLSELVRALPLIEDDVQTNLQGLVNLAMFLALADKDPSVPHRWMQQNRLTFLSIPGFKCEVYETMEKIVNVGGKHGYCEGDLAMFRLVQEKLKPLEGK